MATAFSVDTLGKRIARFVGDDRIAKATNSACNIAIGTNLGSVRKDNQDRALVVWAEYSDFPERNFTLAALSDGMGGLSQGGDAATLALGVFVSRVIRTPRLELRDRIVNAANCANDAVFEAFRGSSGATLSSVLISNSGARAGVNVGDSRIYGLSGTRQLIQLSQDDTLAGVLGDQDEADDHNNRLVQFIGMGEGIEPHFLNFENADLKNFLLTSDGIHDSPSVAISKILLRARSEIDIVKKLLSLSDLLGGQDNGTAIVVSGSPTHDVATTDQGLNLTFLSANDRLEVWIPVLSDEMQADRPRQVAKPERSPLPGEATRLVPANLVPANSADVKETRKSKTRSNKGSSKRGETDHPDLPLGEEKPKPILDIKFPHSE